MLYCTYNLLNMFRALIGPSSGARDYTCVYCRMWCVMPWLMVVGWPLATKALHTICGNNTIIVSSSWWWAYRCPKHVEQIISAMKHSVASRWFSSLRVRTVYVRYDYQSTQHISWGKIFRHNVCWYKSLVCINSSNICFEWFIVRPKMAGNSWIWL